jgi:formate dehydrogenase beta subunit
VRDREKEAETLSKIVLGVWDGQVLDNREQQRELPAFAKVEELGAFDANTTLRAILGWDGFFLFSEDADPVDLARAYMAIVQEHSCGKCIPCRMGTRVAAEVLTRIADGHGRESDLTTLRQVGELVQAGSLCELGHTSMNAVLALISAHEDAFLRAIREGTRRPRGTYHAKVTAPCIEACPERLDIPRYIEAIKAGRYSDSLMVIQEKNPLASVCGRVCVRFCEFACRRGQLDDPISIKHLKRFVSDVEMDSAVKKVEHSVVVSPDAPRVAIIGAGPADMTAAYHLLRKGYSAEIFEALGEPGGMAAVGIPDYRLPREVLRGEIQVVEDMGAKVHYHQVLGRDFTLGDLQAQGFAAVFVGIGAQLGSLMRAEGEELEPEGYHLGIDFLRKVNLGEPIPVDREAVVVGGGNVAMDCARSALRLGVERVHLVYRRTRDEMPADKLEVHDAEEEGVSYHFSCNPTRLVIENGRLTGVECVRMGQGDDQQLMPRADLAAIQDQPHRATAGRLGQQLFGDRPIPCVHGESLVIDQTAETIRDRGQFGHERHSPRDATQVHRLAQKQADDHPGNVAYLCDALRRQQFANPHEPCIIQVVS